MASWHHGIMATSIRLIEQPKPLDTKLVSKHGGNGRKQHVAIGTGGVLEWLHGQ
jgi:hypothetical protein